MKRPQIYVDTSVFGGCFDAEFTTWSNALMADFRGINIELGYRPLVTYFPREVATYGRED
jgi:hypothetical protein